MGESSFKSTKRNLMLGIDYRKALNSLTSIIISIAISIAELSRAINALLKNKDLPVEVKASLKTSVSFLAKTISDLPTLDSAEDFQKDLTLKKYKNTKNTLDTSTPEISPALSELYSAELINANRKYPPKLTYKGGNMGRGFYDIYDGPFGKFYGGIEILDELMEKGVKIYDPYDYIKRSHTK